MNFWKPVIVLEALFSFSLNINVCSVSVMFESSLCTLPVQQEERMCASEISLAADTRAEETDCMQIHLFQFTVSLLTPTD